jgi:hypothetical protein
MLVLALQFSRCGDRRVRSAQGIRRRGAGRGIDSLKTEEKTVDANDARWREENLRPLPIAGDDPPVHQLGCPDTGRSFDHQTVWNGLLRKEVIQPHLPVRLPCYDFTPITDPTFDGSLPEGWATGFGCCRLSWCDGRCVQGPGTYSPRRADPGLLATPASWSRVADSNPN